MMTLLQEIHAKMGTHSYTDQCFIAILFRALETSLTEKFYPLLISSKALGSWRTSLFLLKS